MLTKMRSLKDKIRDKAEIEQEIALLSGEDTKQKAKGLKAKAPKVGKIKKLNK